jgi:hypothetical protein
VPHASVEWGAHEATCRWRGRLTVALGTGKLMKRPVYNIGECASDIFPCKLQYKFDKGDNSKYFDNLYV